MMCCMVALIGINDPYEAPERPEITLDVDDPQGRRQSPETMARIILAYLEVGRAGSHLSRFIVPVLYGCLGQCFVLATSQKPWRAQR